MSDDRLDEELSAANPINREFVASEMEATNADALLRTITASGQVSFRQRILNSVDALTAPAWGRAGFVGVLALVAISFVAFSPGAIGGEAVDDIAIPAGTLEVAALECQGSGQTLSLAQDAYSQDCQQPRVDCDPIGGRWVCSSQQIGNDRQRNPVAQTPTTVAPDGSEEPGSTVTSTDDGSALETTVAPDTPTSASTSQTKRAGRQTSDVCSASGSTVNAAVEAFAQSCSQDRADCDLISGQWVCSSEQIDGSSPGATSPATSVPAPEPTPIGDADCISIEAEHLSLTGAWRPQGDGQASGGGFIVWEGLAFQQNNNSPEDVIAASFAISDAGRYRFVWAMRQPNDVANDRANDSWVNFPDADRFGPVGGGSYGGFVKVFGNAKANFDWKATADEYDGQSEVGIDFREPGTYTLELAGRSHGHEIDRIVIYRDSMSRNDAINGQCDAGGPGTTPSPTTVPAPIDPDPTTESTPETVAPISGLFDEARDLISLHYDHAPDRDDGHATVAGRMLVDSYGITPWVVGGAYGTNWSSYQPSSEVVMDATWASNWVNADADWSAAVTETADRWQQTLDRGGSVWIAEGGQSDLTADVVRELRRRLPDLDTTARIHLVQHSSWNEEKTSSVDLSYVRRHTDYIRIDDGNSSNDTADLNAVTPGWEDRALASRWGTAWTLAFQYLDPDYRLDFSDTVELLHMLGIPKNEIGSTEDFADRFFG